LFFSSLLSFSAVRYCGSKGKQTKTINQLNWLKPFLLLQLIFPAPTFGMNNQK